MIGSGFILTRIYAVTLYTLASCNHLQAKINYIHLSTHGKKPGKMFKESARMIEKRVKERPCGTLYG